MEAFFDEEDYVTDNDDNCFTLFDEEFSVPGHTYSDKEVESEQIKDFDVASSFVPRSFEIFVDKVKEPLEGYADRVFEESMEEDTEEQLYYDYEDEKYEYEVMNEEVEYYANKTYENYMDQCGDVSCMIPPEEMDGVTEYTYLLDF
ncbi:hypothetical protein ABG067_007922 [Albugo candida]